MFITILKWKHDLKMPYPKLVQLPYFCKMKFVGFSLNH